MRFRISVRRKPLPITTKTRSDDNKLPTAENYLPVVGFFHAYGDFTVVTGFIYVLTNFVSLFLMVLEMLMIVRMLLSWFPIDDNSPILNFVYAMTEPLILPVRIVLERSEAVQALPIDLSFFVAFLLLGIIQTALPVVV